MFGSSRLCACIFLFYLLLDCFYAQCECVRLGWDTSETSLALLQWNSVLAVTYPARNLYQIKRGDSWEAVRQKSNNQCKAVHVALLQTNGGQVAEASLNLVQEYDQIYKANDEQKEIWRKQELGVRRHSTEGKACIERYRIASARILDCVTEWITESNLPIKLERASIDEFFIDVTEAVHAADAPVWQGHDFEATFKETQQKTVTVGDQTKNDSEPLTEEPSSAPLPRNDGEEEEEAEDDLVLWKASMIAYWIRQRIRQTFGFTLSAGVGPNKTIAKLSATYGKPNGQAVTFPRHVEYLLDHTKISKCRNLGGKLGNAVAALLPADVNPTVGNIRRYLSLTELQRGLQNKLSQSVSFVYNLARGMDDEVVTPHNDETADGSGLTKSITAFKSFPTSRTTGLTLVEAVDWIKLLAEEVVGRVERDRQRNRRYPKSCSVHYALPGWRSHQSRSVRINFPAEGASVADKVAELCRNAPIVVAKKEAGNSHEVLRLGRFGLCATDFITRESGQQGMEAFMGKVATGHASQSTQCSTAQPETTESPSSVKVVQKATTKPPASSSEDQDMALAMKLQATYDRENNGWQHLDKRRKIKQAAGKTKKISSFFAKR